MPRLARLDLRVSAWTAGWRDHFLLITRLRVRHFHVNALISDRRGNNHALMLGWGEQYAAPHRSPMGLCPAVWSSQLNRAYYRSKQQEPSPQLTRLISAVDEFGQSRFRPRSCQDFSQQLWRHQ